VCYLIQIKILKIRLVLFGTFLLTLRPNAQPTAQKLKNNWHKCVLQKNFAPISGSIFYIYSKESLNRCRWMVFPVFTRRNYVCKFRRKMVLRAPVYLFVLHIISVNSSLESFPSPSLSFLSNTASIYKEDQPSAFKILNLITDLAYLGALYRRNSNP
jgi:hypothetical protein